jgi:hypothetical protein
MTGREDKEEDKVMNEGSKKAGKASDREGRKKTGREDIRKEGDPIRCDGGGILQCGYAVKREEDRYTRI